MNSIRDLHLEPADADAAYLAVALVLMADGIVSAAGNRLLEQTARELDVDAARAGAVDPQPRLSAPARGWLSERLRAAAHVDGEPTPAKRDALQRVGAALDLDVEARPVGVRRVWRALRHAVALHTPHVFSR
jgi:hypothetical protein